MIYRYNVNYYYNYNPLLYCIVLCVQEVVAHFIYYFTT